MLSWIYKDRRRRPPNILSIHHHSHTSSTHSTIFNNFLTTNNHFLNTTLNLFKNPQTATMQLSSILSIFTLATAASAVTVSYDLGYDEPSRSLTTVSCSDGVNGLMTKHPSWKVQSDIPRFPYIGGAASIAGWNSPNCGLCKKATYKGKSIYVLAIDHAASGLNVGKKAMDALTNNQASALGRIEATVTNVDKKFCGL